MKKYDIMIYEQKCSRTLLDINELSRFAGLHPELIRRFFMLGLIDPQIERPEPLFDDSALVRIEKIKRLRRDLGVNLNGCALVLDLLERISELEKEVLFYKMRARR